MSLVEDLIVHPDVPEVSYGPPVRLCGDLGGAPTDIQWVAKRLGLVPGEAVSFRTTVLGANLLGALLDSGFVELAGESGRRSRVFTPFTNYDLNSEFRRQQVICHELRWRSGEAATVEVHARHFVVTWTCSIPVDRIGRLFAVDLGNLPGEQAEAAFAIGEHAFQVEPTSLADVLDDGVDEVDWFRVNLLNESFMWMRQDPRTRFGLFGLVSDQYDSRLILALLTKTATALVRASTRSLLRVLGDIYRAPGIDIRRPSMMDHFSRMAEVDDPWRSI